jgi:periplasmic protein TonB
MRSALLSIATALLLAGGVAQAQFSVVPAPATAGPPPPSEADNTQDYKKDFARHVYQAYPMRVYRGKLPPLLYSVMLTETQIAADGTVMDVSIRRPPAIAAVAPWVVQMIKRAGPFPAPAKMGESTIMEIWLVDKSGNFQLDTLTEGQR